MARTRYYPITYRDDLSGYEISPEGRLRNRKTMCVLKGTITTHGYIRYAVKNDNGKTVLVMAHLLVANEFIPNPNGYPIVNHKDENRANPDVSNLEWTTARANVNYGTCQEKRSKIRTKPVNEYDDSGRYIRTWKSAECVREFLRDHLGIEKDSLDAIGRSCKGITKRALGRIWRYYDGDTNDLVGIILSKREKNFDFGELNKFLEIKDVSDEYLYKAQDKLETVRYFMDTPKLTEKEKIALKELFISAGIM